MATDRPELPQSRSGARSPDQVQFLTHLRSSADPPVAARHQLRPDGTCDTHTTPWELGRCQTDPSLPRPDSPTLAPPGTVGVQGLRAAAARGFGSNTSANSTQTATRASTMGENHPTLPDTAGTVMPMSHQGAHHAVP